MGVGLHRLGSAAPAAQSASMSVWSESVTNTAEHAPLPEFKEAAPAPRSPLPEAKSDGAKVVITGEPQAACSPTAARLAALQDDAAHPAVPPKVGVEAKAVPAQPPTAIAIGVAHEVRSIEVSMLTAPQQPRGYEPFATSLTDALREAMPKAVPLPTVYQAVLIHDNEWLAQLLKSGFPVDDQTPFGDTALCAAVVANNREAVELLLLHGADPNKPGREGQPPVALASLRRSPFVLPALLKAGADANATFVKPVPKSVLEQVLFPELKSSLRDDTGVTPLMAVAARGDVESTIELMKHGAKAERPTRKYFRYPINFAAEQEFIFVMRILLGRSPESEPDVLVTVDLSQQKAYLTQFGKEIDRTTVSTGREGYDTPEGRYLVTDKHQTWTSTLYHVAMPYFMRLNCSAIGLHAGYVTGEPASHGCIRLPYDKVKKWFGIVKVGDEVQIVR